MLPQTLRALHKSYFTPIANLRRVFAYLILGPMEHTLDTNQLEEQHAFTSKYRVEEHLLAANLFHYEATAHGIPLVRKFWCFQSFWMPLAVCIGLLFDMHCVLGAFRITWCGCCRNCTRANQDKFVASGDPAAIFPYLLAWNKGVSAVVVYFPQCCSRPCKVGGATLLWKDLTYGMANLRCRRHPTICKIIWWNCFALTWFSPCTVASWLDIQCERNRTPDKRTTTIYSCFLGKGLLFWNIILVKNNWVELSWVEPVSPQAARFGHGLNETTSTLNMCTLVPARENKKQSRL